MPNDYFTKLSDRNLKKSRQTYAADLLSTTGDTSASVAAALLTEDDQVTTDYRDDFHHSLTRCGVTDCVRERRTAGAKSWL